MSEVAATTPLARHRAHLKLDVKKYRKGTSVQEAWQTTSNILKSHGLIAKHIAKAPVVLSAFDRGENGPIAWHS